MCSAQCRYHISKVQISRNIYDIYIVQSRYLCNILRTSVGPVSALLTPVLAMTEASQEANVAALIGTPALQQIVDKVDIYRATQIKPFNSKFVDGKSDSEKKELLKKIEVQLVTFNGKEKLSIDEYYSVLKVQVCRN